MFDGSLLVRQGTFYDQACAYREFQSKDWYIRSHKVLWKGLLAERDVVMDVNALLAGNDVEVSPPPVVDGSEFPGSDELSSKLYQVSALFAELPRDKTGLAFLRPDFFVIGRKSFRNCHPRVDTFKVTLTSAVRMAVCEGYLELIESIREIFPTLQAR